MSRGKICVATLVLGLWPKQGHGKVQARSATQESHGHSQSYGQKRGWELKCQFDSRPLKVKNRFDLIMCKWRLTYHWKVFNKGYNFTLNLTSIKSLHKKLWTFKVTKISISELLIWESWNKMTFGCKPHG
jgi:hypothetical protein